MDDERRVWCRENQGLADHVLQKKREYADKPKGLSKILGRTFDKAYRNVCDSKDPINTLKDLSQIKGVGKWMLNLVKGYFDTGAETSGQEDLPESCAGNKAKGRKRYTPRRNSVAYALLITLLRGTANGKEFMRKAELIAATEASGLSHAPVAPEKGKGKAGLGNSKREWDSGWSAMTTLILKGLVAKSSNPAKYMLTDAGREVANECITRSGLPTLDSLSDDEMDPDPAQQPKKPANQSSTSSYTMREEQTAIPDDILVKFIPLGYSKEQVVAAFREVSDGSQDKDPSTLCLSVMCHLRQAAKKKKKRVCCDFCSGNRYEDDESVESKLKRLRLVIRRMSGNDLYGLSYDELLSLRKHLCDAKLIVGKQMEKILEAKETENAERREAEDKDKVFLAPASSSGEAPPKKSKIQIAFERQKAESMESQVNRLWLLKERMSGRELGNMNYWELCLLQTQMNRALSKMSRISANEVFYLLSV